VAKIVSRKLRGVQPVYDIGLAKDHNFLLENGFVASNCFNKSHSTAYGYVTFQTAYLKANYPVEYMAALLTANSDDQEKVQKYISTCLSMGIQVQPPDINRSGVDFTPMGESILFGLSAVRNVGGGAIESILQTREQEGPFSSLADLCSRVDPRTVNRRAMEALIQCGAMDCIEKNRNQLLQDLELVLDWAQSRARDRAIGQGNLFDMFGGSDSDSNGFEMAPKAPPVEDLPQQEKLKMEKELLGFYVSDHPLKSVHQAARLLAPINLADLEDQHENTTVSAVVMITSVKPVTTKKGDRMAIVQLEDLSGHAEAVVFPKSYARIGSLLEADARLMVWGKVDKRDERSQLLLDDAEPIDAVQLVMVELEPKMAEDFTYLHEFRNVLMTNRGEESGCKTPVIAIITNEHRRELVRLGPQFRVQDHDTVVSALNQAGFRARLSALTSA